MVSTKRRGAPRAETAAMSPRRPGRAWLILAAALVLAGRPARAQTPGVDPLVFGGGRVAIGGHVSATVSCATGGTDPGCGDEGYFNYSDYERSTLRMLRLTIDASVQANRRLAFLAELRSENGGSPAPHAWSSQC